MSEIVGWILVLGLFGVVACLFLLSRQMNEHLRSTLDMMIRSNDMILAHLESMGGPKRDLQRAGLVPERRVSQRRDSSNSSDFSSPMERRRQRGRRLEDLQTW